LRRRGAGCPPAALSLACHAVARARETRATAVASGCPGLGRCGAAGQHDSPLLQRRRACRPRGAVKDRAPPMAASLAGCPNSPVAALAFQRASSTGALAWPGNPRTVVRAGLPSIDGGLRPRSARSPPPSHIGHELGWTLAGRGWRASAFRWRRPGKPPQGWPPPPPERAGGEE
jgi:hypothetical protein